MLSYTKKYRSVLWILAFVPLTSCSMDFPWTNKEPQPLAQPLPVDDKPKRLAIGSTSVVGVKADGTVWSWGVSLNGELGMGQPYSRQATPTQISNMTNFVEVATGGEHYLALRKDGTVWSWGENRCGQLGYETEPEMSSNPVMGLTGYNYSTTPKQIKELKEVISVAAGSSYSVALTKSGDVYTFGCNEFGQLGLGYVDETKNNKKARYVVPQKVGNVPDAIKTDANVSAFFIITKNKEIFIGGIIYSKIKKKSFPIKITKINFTAVDTSLGFYDIYILNDKGFLYRVGLEDVVENKLITESPELINRGDSIVNVQYSFEGYMILNSDKKIYHLNRGSKASIPDVENISELYSANGFAFAALTTDGKVYFWGDYSHGIRGLGNPQELGKRYLAATTKRGKTPELSLWRWK